MTIAILYENNDTVVEISGLQNGITKQYINNGSASFVVQKDGIDVTGQAFPVTMIYAPNTRGVYRGMLSAAADVAEGDIVDIIVSVTGGGLSGQFKTTVKVRRRT